VIAESGGRGRVLAVVLALVVTPVLHALAFPPWRLGALAWVAFVPWFAALRTLRPIPGIVLTSVVTLAGTYLVASWLPSAVANYYAQPLVVGLGLFLGAWLVTMAAPLWAFTLCYRVLARRFPRTGPLFAGAAWTANELARVSLGNPFGLLGNTQVGAAPLVQVADLTGVYGVSFLVAAGNAVLAEVWLAVAGSGRRRRNLAPACALVGALVLADVGYGLARLRNTPDGPVTSIAVAQANLDLGSQWRQDFYGRNLEEYMRLTLEALRARPARLVVWPESAMTFFLEDEPLYRRAIARVLEPFGVELLAGGPHVARREPPVYFNSAFVIAPDGDVVARYDKEQLLPFAEYFPLAAADLLRREFARVREFASGTANGPLPTVAGPAGIVICNEILFPRLAADRVRDGAGFLVNLTNDAWLGDPKFATQALDTARLRAVEQRRWVVRSSTSGPSAIIDPTGHAVAASDPFARAWLAGEIRTRAGLTPYGRLGDVFAASCVLATLVGTLAPTGRSPSSP